MPELAESTTSLPELVFADTHMRSGVVRMHAHVCPELILVIEGYCQVDLDEGQLHASAGDMLFIPSHCSHNQVSDGYIHTLYAGFYMDVEPFDHAQVIHLDDVQMAESCMNLLADSHNHRCSVSPASRSALLYAILCELESVQSSHNNRRNTKPARLRAAERYIDQHLSGVITIEDLAGHLDMSASNLYLMFRKHLNTTPMHFVMKERMKRARRYLADPYLTVKDVAQRCGYKDSNLFVRTFKKVHGKPPGLWRSEFEATDAAAGG